MAKINQLTRYCRILNRLGGLQEFVSTDELLAASTGIMSEDREYTVRTLQRDIKTIEEVFGVDIEFIRGKGYHIVDRTFDNSLFAGLLADYQILSTMHEMPGLYEYVVPEHRMPMVGIDIGTILRAIMNRRIVRFTYAKPQVGECAKDYVADPYFIKQSQGKWYLFAMVEDHMRSFELGRFRSFTVTSYTFERDLSVDPATMFSNAFGIWDDENLPVEHIVFSVSRQEWIYLQTYPIHHSQAIVKEDNDRVTLSLDVKITHDLLMDLLSRSHSITIIEPEDLRINFRAILQEALERNK